MREHLKNNLMSFFIIVTLVNIAIFLSGMILAPDEKIGYTAFIVPVIDGVLGIIPGLVMYSKRELSVKQMAVREVIQLILIELIIFLFMFGFSGVSAEQVPRLIVVIGSVAVVFVAVKVIMYLFDFRTARKMTDELKLFQEQSAH